MIASRQPGPTARSDRAPTIGVDLGGTKILTAVMSPSGRIRSSYEHPTIAQRGAERIVEELSARLRTLLRQRGRGARGVGVGVAGQISPDGVVVAAPNLGWSNVPLRQRLERALGIPVTVTNDVRAVTFGEWTFGAGRGARDLACVFVGTGVGGGFVADGRLRYGASDTAGEVGHMTIVANGRPCHCRNRGCLEAYVGGWAIAERAQEIVRARPREGVALIRRAGGIGAITARTVTAQYLAKDPLAREIMASTAEYLAAGMVGVVNAFDPAVLALGGGVIDNAPFLLRAVASRVRARALAVPVEHLRIVPARLGKYSGVMGAAAMVHAGVTTGTAP
ncbi:MAG: ROK family protein [Thermoplasmata archaeon]